MSTQEPCGACKAFRRICSSDCKFAPLFPADQPQKFAMIHNVYDSNSIAKILQALHPRDQPGALQSLVFEAECRLRDPVYGVVGCIYSLQQQIKQIQTQLWHAKTELARYKKSVNPENVFTPQPQMYHYPPSGCRSNIMSSELGGLGFPGNNYCNFGGRQVQPQAQASKLPFQGQQPLMPVHQSSGGQVKGQGDQGSQKVMLLVESSTSNQDGGNCT